MFSYLCTENQPTATTEAGKGEADSQREMKKPEEKGNGKCAFSSHHRKPPKAVP